MKNKNIETVIRSAILGHAVADALGVPVEFQSRRELTRNPVTEMRAYGTHHQPAGTWSDDTSMTIAALDSLSRGVDFDDVMRCFLAWMEQAAYTATDVVFDMGIATTHALRSYRGGKTPLQCGGTGEHDNGNGSLMRIIPFVLYSHCKLQKQELAERMDLIHKASRLTHGHLRSQLGCGIYAFVMDALLETPEKSAVAKGLRDAYRFYTANPAFQQELTKYSRVFDPAFAGLSADEIKSSGYVVDSLEAALWCILTTESYAACVLKAVNLGSDTDTVAAIAGGLAGILYGVEAIPVEWLDQLKKRAYLETLCRNFAESLLPECVMVDVHAHVVPNIDDGSANMEMSMVMLKTAYAQGVRAVIGTSHSYPDQSGYQAKLEMTNRCLKSAGIDLTVYPGSEIRYYRGYLFKILTDLQDGWLRTLNGTDYVMLEFSTEEKAETILDCVYRLHADTAYKVVIAHAERYRAIQKDPALAEKLVELGALIQINAFSLEGEQDSRISDTARSLLSRKLVSFLGSDAHRMDHRPPAVRPGLNYLYTHCDQAYADAVAWGNAVRLLRVDWPAAAD